MYRVMVTPTTGSRRRRQATQGERVCTLLSPCEVPANESSVIVVGLDRDTSYSVTVNAVNSEGGVGPTSMPISAPRTTISTPNMIGKFTYNVSTPLYTTIFSLLLYDRHRDCGWCCCGTWCSDHHCDNHGSGDWSSGGKEQTIQAHSSATCCVSSRLCTVHMSGPGLN